MIAPVEHCHNFHKIFFWEDVLDIISCFTSIPFPLFLPLTVSLPITKTVRLLFLSLCFFFLVCSSYGAIVHQSWQGLSLAFKVVHYLFDWFHLSISHLIVHVWIILCNSWRNPNFVVILLLANSYCSFCVTNFFSFLLIFCL